MYLHPSISPESEDTNNAKAAEVTLHYASSDIMLTENITKVPPNGCMTTCDISCSSQRCTTCRHAVGGLYQIFNRTAPITEHLGTSLVTGLQLDLC